MADSMKVEILREFPNPKTGRRAKVGQKMNVPRHRFWFKRIQDGDCKEIKAKPKSSAPQKSASKESELKYASKESKKGSKQ